MSRGGRKLTSAERLLWSSVAKTARPLSGRRLDAPWPPTEESSRKAVSDVGAKAISAAAAPSAEMPMPPAVRRKPTPGLQPIERPVTRKIARGRLSLDARIDLHGMMQAEAHDLLHAFLARSHACGLRHVLVITGKGSSMGSEGVLKRAVPQWLAMPGLRPIVSGYETAARGHGGEGALYVRLKRRRDRP